MSHVCQDVLCNALRTSEIRNFYAIDSFLIRNPPERDRKNGSEALRSAGRPHQGNEGDSDARAP